jgi:hypothetical protein
VLARPRHHRANRDQAADRLAEALGALGLTLTADELAAIEAAVPATSVAGDRYDPGGMASLDSEKQ